MGCLIVYFHWNELIWFRNFIRSNNWTTYYTFGNLKSGVKNGDAKIGERVIYTLQDDYMLCNYFAYAIPLL